MQKQQHSESSDRKATIVDVARVAATSIATVSRVLSKSNYPVKAETRTRIMQAVEKVGYTPNLLGKMLKTNTNTSIGIIIPTFENPFFVQIIQGISERATSSGYTPLVFSSQRNPILERNLIEQLLQKRIMGLMVASVDDTPKAIQHYILQGGKVCVFESNFEDSNSYILAKTDMLESGRIAMKYLLSMGHRNIAIITTPLRKLTRAQTLMGCRIAMNENDLSFSDEDIIIAQYEKELENGLYEFEIGKEMVQKLLNKKKKYTAVLAINDLIACGIMNGLKFHGISVPDEISVIGLDDIPLASMVTPALTTVHMPSYLLGQKACQMMVDALEKNERTAGISLSIQPELVIRDSVIKLS
jgi:LacI family transcriptional regulator